MEPTPVIEKLQLMDCSPLYDERQGAGRKRADEKPNGFDLHLCLRTGVAGVEVRRRVIEEVHANHDSEEPADLRHT